MKWRSVSAERFHILILLPTWVALSHYTVTAWAQEPVTSGRPGLTLLDAVRSTLKNHPLLRSQEAQVDVTRGSLLRASALFDTVFQGRLQQSYTSNPLITSQSVSPQPPAGTGTSQGQTGGTGGSTTLVPVVIANPTTYGSNLTSIQSSAVQLFRNGISVAPQVELNRQTDNVYYPAGINTATASLQVTVPLLRGRGREINTAQENAARIEVDAASYDLSHLMSQLVANVASSYWNVVAARRSVEIAREAESRGKIYIENTQALIAAEHVPRNDLNEIAANLAQRTAARIASEQSLVEANGQLSLDMGARANDMLNGFYVPADPFPNFENQPAPPNTQDALHYYFGEALTRRGDYLATTRRSSESQIQLAAAKNRLLPQLDLSVVGGFTGAQLGRAIQDYLASPYTNVNRPNAIASLTYSFPRRNLDAKGAVLQADAASRQADAQGQQATRNISRDLVVAVANVQNAILRAQKAHESVGLFQASLGGAREKYRLGLGSIVEILQIEDKLTASMTDEVQAALSYALALTQFRFATGTLITPGAANQDITMDTFTTIPFAPYSHTGSGDLKPPR